MPEAMYLQIHDGGSSTARMLELPAGAVRIGRGSHCEVQLADASLADVQCILRLRGTIWHYQPVGPAGRVWIDGRAAEEPRAMPQGVPFRVGSHWLTLRSAQNAFNDWVSFDEPVPFVPETTEGTTELSMATATVIETRTERQLPASTPDENEERLRRWQARLEQRERMLKDRQDERRWEARWKSAGESLRARSGSAHAKPAPSPSRPAPAPNSSSTPRTLQTPPVSRIIEPRPTEPIRRVSAPTVRTEPPRPTVRPLPEPPSIHRRPVDHPQVRMPNRPTIRVIPATPVVTPLPVAPSPSPSRALVTLPSTIMDGAVLRVAPVEPETKTPEPTMPEPEPIAVQVEPTIVPESVFESMAFEEILATATEPEAKVGRPVEESESTEPADELLTEVIVATVDVEAVEVSVVEVEEIDLGGSWIDSDPGDAGLPLPTVLIEPSAWVEELAEGEEFEEEEQPAPIEPPPSLETVRIPVDRHPVAPEPPAIHWSEPLVVEGPRPSGSLKTELPSARAIFEAQGRRSHLSTGSPSVSGVEPKRARSIEPMPTECLAPASWSLPLWLGWLPTLLVTGALGAAGLWLSFEWLVDASGSNVGLKLALRPEGSGSSLIDPSQIPRGSWIFSNATHMTAWAVALARANDGENHADQVRELLAAARQSSPLAARTHFNVEAIDGTSTVIDPNDFSEIGRTRDVVSLISTGRRLREAGKVDASIRAYRSALEIALLANRNGLDPPSFEDSNQIRRYALPHEALMTLVVSNMTERGDWTIQEWISALPPSASASWVASKILSQREKRLEADALADLAIRQGETDPPPRYDPAEHRAAVAEALAYRGRWTDSIEQYRRAIDLVEDDATRRAWWLNLADLAQRKSDDTLLLRALEAAKSSSSVDEITRRAMNYQQNLPGVGLTPFSR